MSPAPSPPDLVDLYVDQGPILAVIGARFGHTADWVRTRLVAAGGYRYGRQGGNQPSRMTRCGPCWTRVCRWPESPTHWALPIPACWTACGPGIGQDPPQAAGTVPERAGPTRGGDPA